MLADQIQVIDTDSHVTEPPDLWTSRVGKELLEFAPRVLHDDRANFDRWWIGDKRLGGVAASATAGWPEPMPSYPPTLDKAHPASWDPAERLKLLDEYGVWASVLYPNLLGFSQYAFLALDEPLRTECVKAYNDFLIDFCSEDRRRLIPIMVVPYWDLDFTLSEVKRCIAKGHKGALFPSLFTKVGLPGLSDQYWDPLYSLAEDAGLPLNLHVAFQALMLEEEVRAKLSRSSALSQQREADQRNAEAFAGAAAMAFEPMRAVTEILTSGLCDRFPKLKFVAVESGVGWMQHAIENLDWMWIGMGRRSRRPNQTMPSDCFRRQVYGTYIFEKESLFGVLESLQDNIMFSTDFPHPASLAPGPFCATDESPREVIERLNNVPIELARKVLNENAVHVYNL
jgi:predicted TIM-barrel fold metal-dependent hydrolase